MELTRYQGLPLGSPAPDFSLPGVDGKTHSLGSFKDKPILVIAFWCNHCPYVQAWEDRTIAVQKEFAGKGVQFVMINANDDESYPEDDFAHMVEREPWPRPTSSSSTQAGNFGIVASSTTRKTRKAFDNTSCGMSSTPSRPVRIPRWRSSLRWAARSSGRRNTSSEGGGLGHRA